MAKYGNYSLTQRNKWKDDFFLHCRRKGIRDDAFEKIFSFNGKNYKIVGMNPNYWKFPIIAKNMRTNTVNKFELSVVPDTFWIKKTVPGSNIKIIYVKNKKELATELKKLYNYIWKKFEGYDIRTENEELIAKYDTINKMVRMYPDAIKRMKKAR